MAGIMNTTLPRTVIVPAMEQHQGLHKIKVTLRWMCPQCGGPRGEIFDTLSYDGSRRLNVHGWNNPCGHIDKYSDVRREANREHCPVAG